MKIISKTKIFETKYINLVETKYLNKKGKPAEWVSAERVNNTKAVMIVAEIDHKLVIIREFRLPIQNFEWSFPAGLIDQNEDVETAVKREFKEETGLEISQILRISPFVINSAGLSNEAIAIAYVKAYGTPDSSLLEDSEELSVHILDKIEIKELMQNPENVFSAKAWIILDNYISK